MPQVDSQNVTVDGGATTTVTLSWQTSSSNPDDTGAYEATAASDSDADTALFTVGSRDLARFVTGFGGGGGSVSRTATASRSATGTTPGGAGTATRTATASRSVTATGDGAGSVAWTSASAWQLPTAPGAGRRVLISPSSVETDHDQLSLTTQVTVGIVDELAHYQEAGDVDRQTTAFGAYRRIRRDDADPVTIRPPTDLTPPFDERRVVPTDATFDQVAPRRYSVELTLGLEEPRPREPLEGSGESFRADTDAVTVDGGATETTTLSWMPDGSQLGDWVVTAASEGSSDTQLVSVSDAPWTLSWPVATLAMTNQQVGQVSRGQASSVPTISLPVRLDAQQAAVLLAVGSRVEATETRFVPDGSNTVVDTLPNDELTISLASPPGADVDDGAFVLSGWSISRDRPGGLPYTATLELVRSD